MKPAVHGAATVRDRLARHDRLTVVTDPWLGGAVSIQLTRTVTRLAWLLAVLAGIGVAVAVWSSSVSAANLFLPLVLVFNATVPRRWHKTALTDRVLADAALRAAHTLGREHKPGVWRIEGPEAAPLAAELQRLQGWWTPGRNLRSGQAEADRQRELVAQARPPLTTYLGQHTAELPGVEPRYVIPENFEPGQPWPIPPTAESRQWPVWPGRGSSGLS